MQAVWCSDRQWPPSITSPIDRAFRSVVPSFTPTTRPARTTRHREDAPLRDPDFVEALQLFTETLTRTSPKRTLSLALHLGVSIAPPCKDGTTTETPTLQKDTAAEADYGGQKSHK
jgi:hypothetical protein